MANPEDIQAQVALCGGPEGMNLPGWDGLSLEDRVATVKRAWAMPVRRLLIFDNLEDRELLAQWRPKTGGGQVLVTSRRGDWRATDGVTELPLRPLDRSASYQVLLGPRAYEQERPVEALLADPQQQAAADAICDELGDLPLALALAGAYLADNPRLALADYHRRLQELLLADPALTDAMAAEAGLPTRYQRGVAAALTLSYAQLTPEKDAAALSLFHRLAWLASLPIPEALLTALSDGQAPDPALRRLRAVGLIDRREVQLHRLIVAFGRERDPELAVTLSDTVTAVLAAMDDQDLDRMPLAGTPYRPHLEELCWHTDRLADVLAARLLMQTGRLLDIQGEYAAARPLLERALAIRERSLGPDHPDTATSLNNLALCLQAQGAYAEARPLLERALAIRERSLGPDHPDTRIIRKNLTDLNKE
ncbi:MULTISPECIES: tetratricopeptide repeat protein [Chloroflexus]|nr:MULTISPECIES: tetratricopeptide repeat protein [Chloroflexus]